ncbi:MAG: SH3 domain-containing protein, partial [Acidimicrobiia bacterium]|nr:SH3 domain-containing protein [Acidimicrobiia bacterium]
MPCLRAALICAVFCVGSLSACGDDDGIDTTAAPTTSQPTTTSTTGEPSTTATTSTTTTLLPTTTATTYPWDTIAVPATSRCVVDHLPGDALNVRSGPSGDYPVIGTLAFNATGVWTTGVGAEDDSDRVWAAIDYDGGSGWVASWFLTPGQCGPASPGPFCVVDTACTDRLNVRSGPGTGFDVIGSLAHDATGVAGTGWASVGEPDEMWTQIEWGSGVGWVASWFVTGVPCSASTGAPCSCDSGGYAFIHSVDTIGRFLEYDPVVWVWVGPADTDYEWDNSDPTVYWLPLDDDL